MEPEPSVEEVPAETNTEDDSSGVEEESAVIESEEEEADDKSSTSAGNESDDAVKAEASPADADDDVSGDSEAEGSWDDLASSFGLEPEKVPDEPTKQTELPAEAKSEKQESTPETSDEDASDEGPVGVQELGAALEAAATEDETAKAIDDLFANFQPTENEAEEILADVESAVEDEGDSESLDGSGEDNSSGDEESESEKSKSESVNDEKEGDSRRQQKDNDDRSKPSRKKKRGNKPSKETADEPEENKVDDDVDDEKKRNIPTWGDTIDGMIESNIARHKNSSRGRGPSRKKG